MNEHVDNLLRTEAAVEELQGELSTLLREVKGYAGARSALSETHHQLSSLIERQQQLADKAASAIGRLGEVGATTILESIDKIQEGQRDLREILKDLSNSTADSQSQVLALSERAESLEAKLEASELSSAALTKRVTILMVLSLATILLAGTAATLAVPGVQQLLSQ